MSTDASSFYMAHPNYTEPELMLQYNQKSDFMDLLAGGAPRARLDDEDKYVYLRQLGLKTQISSGSAGANQLPSCSITTGLASAPTYLQQVIAEYDHHQTKMLAQWGCNIVEGQRLAMRQAHALSLRNKALFGELPANGEGFLNAPNATYITLPPDTLGNVRFSTYDNGQMALFLLGIVGALLSRTYNLGQAQKIAVLGPQEILVTWQMTGIVQITSFQRAGGGSDTIEGTVEEILKRNGVEISFGYDDTLIGAGAGGTDAVIFAMPEVKKPDTGGMSTNLWAGLTPGFSATTLQYTDKVAPVEFPTPVPNNGIHILSELRATSGWAPRPEALTILSGAI